MDHKREDRTPPIENVKGVGRQQQVCIYISCYSVIPILKSPNKCRGVNQKRSVFICVYISCYSLMSITKSTIKQSGVSEPEEVCIYLCLFYMRCDMLLLHDIY